MHYQVMDWVARKLKDLPEFERVLEIGSYNVNGTVRHLFTDAKEYVGVDVREGPGVDVVEDGADYKSRKLFDAVVITETLEHAANADKVVANAYKLLRKGGYLIATMATDPRVPHNNDGGAVFGEDEFYENVSKKQLEEWLEEFDEVEIERFPDRGDLYVVAQKG